MLPGSLCVVSEETIVYTRGVYHVPSIVLECSSGSPWLFFTIALGISYHYPLFCLKKQRLQSCWVSPNWVVAKPGLKSGLPTVNNTADTGAQVALSLCPLALASAQPSEGILPSLGSRSLGLIVIEGIVCLSLWSGNSGTSLIPSTQGVP